ncbi:F420-dependent oxidoreductase-like protein [Actinoplanes campanulatus]|uniref:F420-dependent oxidoreductase-like protein n=1 Tax=Actinoplanes campanulatus TaxID=113559 RepID=A0A7W5AHM4_9ACTN|nr:LLM class F420-dependent oxidoreductase [Actinoplanes campanulatus]MBB3096277.1 F420-dependent oxidoreductase-like protein [Actinoplanes campanulatus]GGN19472.1 LLM class F420-dependent oxidoreductase [Actinoplanes campanulatus]GID41631.1 LLM class F420-dependent oxidoreductase [Actinoplanes campanulatus]
MRLATTLMYAGDPRTTADEVAGWERAGLDILWVAEAYGFDAPTIMGYLAAKTERVQIGSAILPIYSRTPALLAQTAAGLDAMSGGRAILGLGASGPQVVEGWHGVPYDKPIGRTREIIEICRAIWRREVIEHDGLYRMPLPDGLGKPLKILTRPVRDRIPVYVASLGAANVRMTAEIADGWLPFLYIPERAADVWGKPLAEGAAKRPTDLAPLEVVAGGPLAIGDDVTGLRDLARPIVALYVGGMGAKGRNFYHDVVSRYGFEAAADRIQELYLSGHKQEAAAAVPDELLELTSLIGPESYVRDRIAAYKEAGVTVLNVIPFGDPLRQIARVKELIS